MKRTLTRSEIQARATEFAERYQSTSYERGEAQTFYNEFFKVFGLERFGNAVFERYVKKVGKRHGFIDLLWPRVLLAEHKSIGHSLDAALEQAEDYLIDLPNHERPQCVLACDFQRFLLVDLDTQKTHRFNLSDLPEKTELFDFLRGIQRRDFTTEDPVSIKASEMMADVYDALKKNGYPEHDAAYFLTKLAFCFFADDTGIFDPRGIMQEYMEDSHDDGSDLGLKITNLFGVLNTPENDRQENMPAELRQFPYVNGNLFKERNTIPYFDKKTRANIIRAAQFDWTSVSPAIFGSLFQGVLDRKTRRREGAHYTTEENIMKVIRPLFLDDLEAKLRYMESRSPSTAQISAFQNLLTSIRILDPACGAGNFLITAYREIRRLETRAILLRKDIRDQKINIDGLSKVNVDQFYGIEANEFSAKIAEVALWMMDHAMNKELGSKFGEVYARIPLEKSPTIINADALEFDWNDTLPSPQCTFICGNPPFGGQRRIDENKRAQIKAISGLSKGGSNLDYVTCWFVKAVRYSHPETKIGFVATNSITQGEQVGQFWPLVYNHGWDISFAHESFKWGSDATGKAQVHVVIVGLENKQQMGRRKKRLFYYEGDKVFEAKPQHISPYILGTQDIIPIVKNTPKPINGLPKIADGVVPLDGGNLTLTEQEKMELLAKEPQASKFLRPFIDADDFLNCKQRWLLYLKGVELNTIKKNFPEVMKRVNGNRLYRASCTRIASRELADRPTELAWGVVPSNTFLLIPRVTSENRKYVPIGYLEPPALTSNRSMVLECADLGVFGLLTSWMHMIWLRVVGGRLENRFSYSARVVYNTFPTPDGSLKMLESHARRVLDSRAAHPSLTLKQLYDAETMPPDLVSAHKRLDRAVERLYTKKAFLSDRDRLVFLLQRYGTMVGDNQKLF